MRKPVAYLFLTSVALLLLSACSSKSNNQASQAPATQAPASTQAVAAGTVTLTKSKLGEILADDKGRTLYAFTVDKGSTSSCYGQCATTWPALTSKVKPTAGAGLESSLLGTTMRTDGSTQVTFKGMPLYYFSGDAKPSDTNGEGILKVWWVVGPTGALIKTTS